MQAVVLVSPGVDITDYWWQSLRPEDQEKCRSLRKIPIPTAYHNEVCPPVRAKASQIFRTGNTQEDKC